jgi:hypothetical protein
MSIYLDKLQNQSPRFGNDSPNPNDEIPMTSQRDLVAIYPDL